MELKNKVVIITGATGGMGLLLCDALAEKGAKLVLGGRNTDKLAELTRTLSQKYDAEILTQHLDVTGEDSIVSFIEAAHKRYGKLDVLVNLAGISIPGQIAAAEESVYDTIMDVNVKGTYLMAKHFAGYTGEEAMIVNMGSMAARRVNANAPLYCMAKTAVNVLSDGLAMQLAKMNIRVTTLNPGGADTPFWGDRPVAREKLLQPEDIVVMILFVLETNARIAIHSIDFESMQML